MEKSMKNDPEKVRGLSQSNIESEEAESPIKPEEKRTIVFNKFQEPTRPYFSSPCLLSEIEDDEDVLNR